MDLTEFAQASQRVLDPNSLEYAEASAAAARVPADLADVVLVYSLATEPTRALGKLTEFKDGGFLIELPEGAVGFHAQEAAVTALRIARESGNVGQAVAWLGRVLATERAEGTTVMALLGVTVGEPLALTEDIRLVPIDAIPASPQLEWLLRPRDLGNRLHFLPPTILRSPKAALTMRAALRPVLTPAVEGATRRNATVFQTQLLEDARLALTAIGPSAPLRAGAWFQFDSPDLQRAAMYSGVYNTPLEIMPSWFAEDVALRGEMAKEVVAGFLQLEGSVRDRVRMSLTRLNQAVRRATTADKALELAIALEALLADGPGENTYKVGLRAALLCAGSAEERLQKRAIVSAVYMLRSAVVHNGRAPDKEKVRGRGKVSSEKIVEEGLVIGAEVVRQVIRKRKVPEWYSLELSS